MWREKGWSKESLDWWNIPRVSCVLQSQSSSSKKRSIWGTRYTRSSINGLAYIISEKGKNTDTTVRKYTYSDGLTSEQMSEVCFQNYDPAFREIARDDDILVSGFNFGCGSSWVDVFAFLKYFLESDYWVCNRSVESKRLLQFLLRKFLLL